MITVDIDVDVKGDGGTMRLSFQGPVHVDRLCEVLDKIANACTSIRTGPGAMTSPLDLER